VTLTGIGDRWRGVDLTIDTTPEDIDD